jgi:hypothetical protein
MLSNDGSGMVMPVGPMYGNGGFGNGGFADGSFWIIVLFLFALMGNGWGNAFGGGGGAMPFMMSNNTNNDVQRGFDQQAIMTGINGLNSSIVSLAQGQCSGFANVENAASARQMANLQQQFAMQTGLSNQLNTIAMNQQNCCCEHRAAVADLKYTMAQESAATRSNTDAKAQMLMDKLCQLELDGVKQNYENRIAGMQGQIDALTAQVNNANRDVALANEVDALYNRLNSCPVPTTPVYGRTPIFTCNQSQNPGCPNGFMAA